MRRMIGLVALTLIGCAAAPVAPKRDIHAELNEDLQSLVGKNIEYANNFLGEVTAFRVDNGLGVATWRYSLDTGFPMGDGLGDYVNVPAHYQCWIELTFDQSHVIQRWNAGGNIGGCEHFANELVGVR